MIEKIPEENLWTHLKNTDLPILLYGMGDGADKIISVLEGYGLSYCDTFASDGFVRGHYFHGKRVLSFSEAKEKYDNFIILVTFAVHDAPTINRFVELSKEYEIYAPTVALIDDTECFTREYIQAHDREFDEAYSALADERSRQVFVDILRFKVSGKIDILLSATDEKMPVYSEILCLADDEDIVDLGAYDGDTIREFMQATDGKYSSITAFEPDEKNFRKLTRKTEGMQNLTLVNCAAWSEETTRYFSKKAGRNSRESEDGIPVKFNSVDNVVSARVSFIKMDIEGAEMQALEGAKNTISAYKPKLYVCAYHRNEDFFALPKKILSLCPDYKIYLRHSPYVPAWETNFYCVFR